MRPGSLAVVLVALLVAPVAAPGEAAVANPVPLLELVPVASGLSQPVFATHAGDGSGRLFIVEQRGLVRVLAGGVLDPVPYLDLRAKVSCCGERGLLGLAFHPEFERNGRLFASYTDSVGASVLEAFQVADPRERPDPHGGVLLLAVAQPFANHNGGWIGFGPDGYLYLALGDGGSAGDPQGHGQNKHSLLGKMLRLDVDAPRGYAIPPTNPFAGGGGRPEIWAYGLRNPWRPSFDRVTGDLWIADVGQSLWEEVNRQSATSLGGENYGWNAWEGLHPFRPSASAVGVTFPVIEYSHASGCSVTGGYVYRGSRNPDLVGTYVYGDFCTGTIWGAPGAPTLTPVQLLETPHLISSFGEDEYGELYVLHHGGSIHRIVQAPPPRPPLPASSPLPAPEKCGSSILLGQHDGSGDGVVRTAASSLVFIPGENRAIAREGERLGRIAGPPGEEILHAHVPDPGFRAGAKHLWDSVVPPDGKLRVFEYGFRTVCPPGFDGGPEEIQGKYAQRAP